MVDESLREAQTLGSPIYNVKHLDGEVHEDDKNGIYIRDIINQEMKIDDLRL